MAISGGDGSIILTTKIDESGLSDGLKSLRKGVLNFEKALKGVAVAGAGAFVAVGTAAIKTYADFEQLSGGVQKIFDEIDYATIEKDAQEAFKTMQMSANQYLEVMTTVGANFASTLGDAKGYEVAKQGMKAITDFATGTGRSVDELSEKYQMITKSTSSYQSIADQFAGILPATSAGFLEQAQAAGFLSDGYTKLTEVPMAEYQEAVTQMLTKGVDALGLTDNAANEASTTLSGSFSMLKGSWDNLLVAFANPEQDLSVAIDDLKNSLSAVADNLLPRIGEVFGSIFGSIPTPILAVASAIGAVVAGITAYNAVMKVKNVLDAIQKAGSIKLALAQIGLNTAMLASPITWVVAGITALVAAFVLLWNKCEGFRNFWIGLWDKIKGAFVFAWEGVKTLWNEHIKQVFTKEWWLNLGKNVMNGLISGFEAGINGIIGMFEKMINWIVNGLNKISFDVPDWVPLIGGKKFGFNIPKATFGRISIPRLAQGAVIPPNREFLAVLGDQKQGTNIETPESLLREIYAEGNAETNALLQQLIQVMQNGMTVNVDGKQLMRINREAETRVGRQTVTGGFANAY